MLSYSKKMGVGAAYVMNLVSMHVLSRVECERNWCELALSPSVGCSCSSVVMSYQRTQ